jgi:heme/copper-type cytochrome/quinol oxidase subunit 2
LSHQGTKDPTVSWVFPGLLGVLCVLGATDAGAQPPREVVASKSGWRPAVINLKKGEPARLLLKTEDEEHCFAVDELRIEKRIVPGKSTPLELTADRAGNFAFYDCLNPEGKKGRLAVSE